MPSNAKTSTSEGKEVTETSTPSEAPKVRSGVWFKTKSLGNSVDISKAGDGWVSAGMPKPAHEGKILPHFAKKNDDSGNDATKDAESVASKDVDDVDSNDATDDNDEKSKFPVYIIHSKWPVDEIEEFIDENSVNGIEEDAALMRIDYFKGDSTDRTIVVLNREVYDNLLEAQLPGFSISPFKTGVHWQPKPDENDRCFFVKLPPGYPASKCRKSLFIKLQEMVDFEILGSVDDYNITIPLKGRDRESNEHTGQAYIDFKETVDLEAIVMARVLIAYSYWNYHMDSTPANNYRVCCYYKKDRNASYSGASKVSREDKDGWQESNPSHDSNKSHSKKASKREKVTIKIPTIDTTTLQNSSKNASKNVPQNVPQTSENPFDALGAITEDE